MIGDKLVSLLTSFSKVELNRFRKFLLSPYLNDLPETTRLFDTLNDALRKDTSALLKLPKESIWKTLYPGKPYDDGQLRRLSSDLSQLALQFMAAEYRKTNPFAELLDLQKALEEQPLRKHLASTERQIERILEETDGLSADHFLYQFQAKHRVFMRDSKVVGTIGYGEKLSSADYSLDCFYLIQKIKYYIAWLQYSGIRETPNNIPLIPGFWEYINEKQFSDIPLFVVYRKVFNCLTETNNEEYFNDYLHSLETYSTSLAQEDLRECYQIAQNYCALKVNQGITEYYPIFFRVIKKVVQLGILLENNVLSEGVFKNMITISMWVGEFKWAEHFIEEYARFLPVNIQENARKYSLANIYFRQKKHEQVIQLLQNVEYNDIVYALGSKLILLRTYYETNETLALESLIDSFRIFIRRNKLISKNQKREYNNFLNFVKKLTVLHANDSAAIHKFKELVTASSSNMPKKWLLEKIDELEKR